MTDIVSRNEWLEKRLELLAEEKQFSKTRDALSAKRRALPKVRLDTDYMFTGASGAVSMDDLFGNCSQLIVYHFMYGPDWDAGCPSCSYWADNFSGTVAHLNARDAAFAVVSAADFATLAAYQNRMGWDFTWVSAKGSTFNQDFRVSFTEEEQNSGKPIYNFNTGGFPSSEAPGISVFLRDETGTYHTYSTFARGLDMMNGAYHYMDLLPKGRDEAGLAHSMAWLRRRDEY